MSKCYENVVFEGGGVRGVAYAGVIEAFEELGVRKTLKRFTGSSIGAFYATMLAMGASTEKITEVTMKMDLNKMRTDPCLLIKIYRLFRYNGLDDNQRIIDSLEWAFRKAGVDPNTTFKQNFAKTKNELYIPGTNINRNKVYFFSHYTHPKMKICNALAISMCFPIVYRPFEINHDLWCDAGIAENYPIYIFNDLEKLKQGRVYSIDRQPINPKTLGIKLLTPNEKNSYEIFHGRASISDLFSLIMELVNTMGRQVEQGDVTPSYISQTIPISNLRESLFKPLQHRDKVIEMGRNATYDYFKNEIKNECVYE